MKKISFLIFLFTSSILTYSQLLLEADGPGSTYELISSKLAPGYSAVENPECIHPEFGRHIAEVWDSTLSKYVFEFYIHVTPDNDRCKNFDRQRIEIKTYDQSPDSLLGVIGEAVIYKWKFKLDNGFQPSSSFTHIHQIKPVGGDDGNPIIALTPRKGSPNKMELTHNNKTKVRIIDLSQFLGNWVECTEIIYFHPTNGRYSMSIKNISDGNIILDYSNDNLMTIRPDNEFNRPKWGIYRSLNDSTNLRDEAVRFADFLIQEEKITDVDEQLESLPSSFSLDQNYPNPFNPSTIISYIIPSSIKGENSNVKLTVHNLLGKEIAVIVNEKQKPGKYKVKFDGSKLASGIYIYKLLTDGFIETKKMVLLK
ncbi:MAG: T9SS type A sorting domain-containing protein [Ignavibacteriales bacterium]|nr:T9SS type A sorting domain-containing protein [Ignavibacteriales bacterium]